MARANGWRAAHGRGVMLHHEFEREPTPMSDTSKSRTITEQTSQTLDRIARENATLKAFIHVARDTALAEAALADARARAGTPPGLLEGLPIAVKDIVDVAGVVTGCGSLTRRQSPPAERDAPVVQRLRAAGAIVPGKTHTVEYAFGGYGTNVTVGTPWNPWDRQVHRVPGGSSSGTGVAVGAGLVPGGLGTDTGGSVRIPAALCGCVGLKTSIGRVGRSGVAPLSQTLDSVGPLAENVTMAALMFQAMQGPDAADPTTDGVKPVDALADLERGVKGLRLGRIADADMPLTTPEVRADFAAALKRLVDLGATIEPISLPLSFDDYGLRCGQIIAPEAYANWQAHVDDANSGLAPPIRTRMLGGKAMSAADYIGARNGQRAAIDAFLKVADRLDAILLPTIAFPAIPVADVDEAISPMAAHTRWANYLDLCGLAIPTALSQSGLPLSLQIVCRKWDDALALRIGRAFEKARGPFPQPKGG
jgi:aspartyl-tRNA(Asn)/glutamyl-tRNA(Gln) amidotransferase subunit A